MNIFTKKVEIPHIQKPGGIGVSAYLFAILSLFFIAAIVLLGYKWNGSRIIKSMTISGNQYLSTKEIQDIASPLSINKKQEQISLSKLQYKLNSHPFIKKSTLMFSDFERIHIEIKEKLPCLLLENDSGHFYVMEDLSIIPFRKFEKEIEIPIVRNLHLNRKEDTLKLEKILNFVKAIRLDDRLVNSIDIIVLEKNKSECKVYLKGCSFGVLVKIQDNINKKIMDVLAYFQTEYYQKSENKINYIDARWNQKIYVSEKY